VSDEGIGIAEKDQQKTFDRFVQLDTDTKRRRRGHGLGLSITKAMAEMLERKITLSCPPGKGCVFTFTLNEAGGSGLNGDLSEDSNQHIFDDTQQYQLHETNAPIVHHRNMPVGSGFFYD
jgi:hypothetical protein